MPRRDVVGVFGATLVLASSLLAQEPRIRGLEPAVHPNVSDRVAGVVLIRELGCAQCHEDDSERFLARPAPSLRRLGGGVKLSFLRAFLANPHEGLNGTVMPDTLGLVDELSRNDAIESLVQFIRSDFEVEASLPEVRADRVEAGRGLYSSIGCVACHGPGKDLLKAFPGLAAKYSREGLHRFLLDPLKVRPSGRMPDMHLNHEEALQLTDYLLPKTAEDDPYASDERLQRKGKRVAQQALCFRCHQDDGVPTNREKRKLSELDLERGCLSGKDGAWPDYSLTPDQTRLIRAALESDEGLDSATEIEIVLRQFNCVACHERDGYGGPTEALEPYFQSHDLNLGDQGRLPPALDGVGSKLNPVWLRKLLYQHGAVRPYMKTRMPRFASVELESFLNLLVAADRSKIDPVASVEFKEPRKASGHGRTLAGTDGLSCITCHTFKGKKIGAMGAIDLTLVAQRLNRDWFHRYLRSPTDFSPSTLMPAFWGGGESSLPEILDGDVAQQIEALWTYTSEGYSLGTPKGVRREPMQLLASEDEAVMLRRSYPGVGKRGIGVGYPGNVNLVFNVEQLGLAMLWEGGFVDPSGVFLSQGHGTARPLARRPVRFQKGQEMMALPALDSAWPSESLDGRQLSFKGYTLDSKRQPVFRYTTETWRVEDGFVPMSKDGQSGLRRTIRLDGQLARGAVVLRLAGEKPWERVEKQLFRLPDGLTIRVPGGATVALLDTAEGNEVRVRLAVAGELENQEFVIDYLFEMQ